ncbi:MAG: hypothetical protein L0Y62_02155, partial [Nitrospirae bacterium]|nr:hypothetical protein [Nitrospirota bacterium]
MMINRLIHTILIIVAIVLSILSFPIFLSASDNIKETQDPSGKELLLDGKISLDKGDYDRAIVSFTEAYKKLPVLGDYTLIWRAKAYKGKGDTDNALSDVNALKDKYSESLLIKEARIMEITLLKEGNSRNLAPIYDSFVKDYPNEYSIKYDYALYLKEKYLKDNNAKLKAKRLIRDVFLSNSPYAKKALDELAPSEITTEDLLEKGRNLNKAWLFAEAERYFREAMKGCDDDQLMSEILDGLAHALFKQKRYRESSDLYGKIQKHYWRARSLIRSGDIKT